MTESSFPFAAAGEEVAETGTDRKKLLLVAVAGVLAVAVLGYFVVLPKLSGSADDAPVASVVHHRTPAQQATTTAKKAAAKTVAQPPAYADVSARQDPFKPLVAKPVEVPAAAPGAVPPPTGTTGTTGTTAGSTTSGSTSSGSSASVGGQRVALVHVFSKDGKSYAQTKVGDTVYTPGVGGVFAGSYKLLATSGKTATYLFGDEQFSLSEGQEVLK
jgi:hypothetical protein